MWLVLTREKWFSDVRVVYNLVQQVAGGGRDGFNSVHSRAEEALRSSVLRQVIFGAYLT